MSVEARVPDREDGPAGGGEERFEIPSPGFDIQGFDNPRIFKKSHTHKKREKQNSRKGETSSLAFPTPLLLGFFFQNPFKKNPPSPLFLRFPQKFFPFLFKKMF